MISSKCVTERIGAEKYTDAPPTTAFVGKGYFGNDTDASCGVANHTDAEVNAIQPLSSDKTMLKRRIDKLATSGSTAGQLGHGLGLVSAVAEVELPVPHGQRGGSLQRPGGGQRPGHARSCARSPC